jgi:hypothetical protein
MMYEPDPTDVRLILARYGLAVESGGKIRRAGSGFSGADVWQVATSLGLLCVRRWPAEHPSVSRLREIHAVLQHSVAAGCRFVPSPLPLPDGTTCIPAGGRLWEVTPWLPGAADDSPVVTPSRLTATMRALARFHVAVGKKFARREQSKSPGLADRLQRLDRLVGGEASALQSLAARPEWRELEPRRDAFLQLLPRAAEVVRPRLVAAGERIVELIPCIRDIRREHVLFVGDEVTGWVDFGALEMEHPAVDVARVLMEFVGDDAARRVTAVAAYASAPTRPDAAWCEASLVAAFEQSTTILSPYNWFRWIFVEGRDFADRRAVLDRVDRLLARLRRLVETA